MVTFQELNDLRLGKLQSAADLAAKAKAADWKG